MTGGENITLQNPNQILTLLWDGAGKWLQIGSTSVVNAGGGISRTPMNGVENIGTDFFGLGGELTKDTLIDNKNFNLTFLNGGKFNFGGASGTHKFNFEGGHVELADNGGGLVVTTDTGKKYLFTITEYGAFTSELIS